MKYFGKYLGYRLRKSFTYFALITVLASLFAIFIDIVPSYMALGNGVDYPDRIYTSIGILGFVYTAMSLFIPVREFSGLLNKRNQDTLRSLPITKRQSAVAHYLTVIIASLGVMIISFSVYYIRLIVTIGKSGEMLEHIGLSATLPLLYSFITMLVLVILYETIVSFLLISANTITDGAVFAIGWTFLPYLLASVYERHFDDSFKALFSGVTHYGDLEYIIPGLNVIKVANVVNMISSSRNKFSEVIFHRGVIFFLLISAVLAIAALVCFVYFSGRKKAEALGGISQAPHGYRFLIPAYGISLALLVDTDIIITVFLTAAMITGYIMYRRGVKLKKEDIIFTVAVTIISLISK